jgi:outer membrane protein assembly factor BamB
MGQPMSFGGKLRAAQIDTIVFDQAALDSERWVDVYFPDRACNGYTLMFYQGRVPMLIDMNGKIVHSWQNVRGRGRSRLSPEGKLLLIAPDDVLREYSWEGDLLWEFNVDSGYDFPHHDIRWTANGNVLCIFRDYAEGTDYLLELNRDGEIVWEWRWSESHEQLFSLPSGTPRMDRTHFNSIQELPENKWFRSGDDRFKPGNILVSAWMLSAVFVVDKASGEIVWQYDQGLDRQHEALMIEEGYLNSGNILIFNNGTKSRYQYRRSAVIEIDPITRDVRWKYESPHFFTTSGGMQQHLPNGNLLISSTRGGRVFEIDRDGHIAWQWIPPYEPWRPSRYQYDYCQHFAKLGAPSEQPVKSEDRRNAYIDRELYSFNLNVDVERLLTSGGVRKVLRASAFDTNSMCRELLIPEGAHLHIGYGIEFPRSSAVGNEGGLRFVVQIRPSGSQAFSTILEKDAAAADSGFWEEKTISLREYQNEIVTLCLRTEGPPQVSHERLNEVARWMHPLIMSERERAANETASVILGSEPDSAMLERQLKALGYLE